MGVLKPAKKPLLAGEKDRVSRGFLVTGNADEMHPRNMVLNKDTWCISSKCLKAYARACISLSVSVDANVCAGVNVNSSTHQKAHAAI